MAILEYKNKTKCKISEHFDAYEFRCKCGKSHDILIDTDLVNWLENLRKEMNASKIVIKSGYRCPEHDKKVGGSGNGPHTKGKGADIEVYDINGGKILSKNACLKLEDMEFPYGVGYRSGKNEYETHIDTKNRGYKYYFDEGYKPYKSCNGSFYKYFGIPKDTDKVEFTTGIYRSDSNMYVREKPSLTGRIKKVKELNKTMQKALTSTNPNSLAVTAKDHTFTASEIITEKNGRVWFRNINNGYICLKGVDGKVYFTKVK